MIANLFNALVGIWLVYGAVLEPQWADSPWRVAGAGILVLALAWWARTTDSRTWHSTVNVAFGAVLLVLAGLHGLDLAPPLVMFWGLFWPGILVAIVALWAVLYHPGREARAASAPASEVSSPH